MHNVCLYVYIICSPWFVFVKVLVCYNGAMHFFRFLFDDRNCCLYYSNQKNEPYQGCVHVCVNCITILFYYFFYFFMHNLLKFQTLPE